MSKTVASNHLPFNVPLKQKPNGTLTESYQLPLFIAHLYLYNYNDGLSIHNINYLVCVYNRTNKILFQTI